MGSKTPRLLRAIVMVVCAFPLMVFSGSILTAFAFADRTPQGGPARPNIVYIVSDDQYLESVAYMPRVQALLAARGVTSSNAFLTTPVCCPSQTSMLTGKYAHNHQILFNIPPLGGFEKFRSMGAERSTIATWLQQAGYLTGRVGKYLVGYPQGFACVPPGWDEWQSAYGGFSTYYNYSLNENGTVVGYGSASSDYITDVLTQKAVNSIDRAEASDAQPFFLVFSPNAPHGGAGTNGPPADAGIPLRTVQH